MNPWNTTLQRAVQDFEERREVLKEATEHADRVNRKAQDERAKEQEEKTEASEKRAREEAWSTSASHLICSPLLRSSSIENALKTVYEEPHSKHEKCRNVRPSDLDSGRWLLKRSEYEQWKLSPTGLLWVSGKRKLLSHSMISIQLGSKINRL